MELVKIFRILVVINYIAFMSHFVIDYNSFIVSGTDLSTAIEESFVSIIDSWSFIVLLMIVIAAIITGPLLFFFTIRNHGAKERREQNQNKRRGQRGQRFQLHTSTK